MNEKEIKGILVQFFRDATNGDYLDALKFATTEIINMEKNKTSPNDLSQDKLFYCWSYKEYNEESRCKEQCAACRISVNKKVI